MIVKLIRMARGKGLLDGLRDNVFALTRYVTDADPWAMAMIDRQRIRSLAEYLVHAKALGIEPGEKAGHVGWRNLLTSNLPEQQMEMLAIASSAPRVEYPVVHIIVSWQAGENPTSTQLEDTVDTVLAVTGLSRCPVLFAEHTNTEHRHLHVAAVRIDPESGRAAGSEWLIEDLHQSIAILEERHRWSAEPNALYYARNGAVFDAYARRFRTGTRNEKIVDPISEVMVRDAEGGFVTNRDWNGLPSDFVNARAEILQALPTARSWIEFHALLGACRVAYRAKGSGARLHFGDASAKASTVSPDLALKKLEARWGPFIPHALDRIPGFDEYRAAHQAQLKRLRADRAAVQEALDKWAAGQIALIAAAKNHLVEKAIRAERDAAQRELNAAFATAIKICTQARHVTAESWRAANSPANPPLVESPSLLLPTDLVQDQAWRPPATFRAEQHQWSTCYYDAADRLMFTDHRSVIVIHQPSHVDGLDTALKLAAERWGTVRIRGSNAFTKRCAERAVALGIALVDSDNKPLKAERLVAPITSTAPAVVTTPVRPDHRTDPARKAAIEQVLTDLAQMGTIPMRRRQIAGQDGGTAPLEIVVETDRYDPKPQLTNAALFDEDRLVQAFLEKQRAEMLSDVRHHLRQLNVQLDRKAIVDSLRGPAGLGRAAFLAFADADFQRVIEQIAAERVEYIRSTQRADQQRQREHDRHRAQLAMLARIFHDQSWDPREWRSGVEGLRKQSRTLTPPAADADPYGFAQHGHTRSSQSQTR